MDQPIFYFKKLTVVEQVTILLYVALSFGLYFYLKLNRPDDWDTYVAIYGIATQLGLYHFGSKSLRNLTCYICWLAIAVAHLYIYFQIKKNDISIFPDGNFTLQLVAALRNTVLLLALYQLLRLLSLKLQHLELAVPTRSGNDGNSERQITLLDILFNLIYIGAMLYLAFVV